MFPPSGPIFNPGTLLEAYLARLEGQMARARQDSVERQMQQAHGPGEDGEHTKSIGKGLPAVAATVYQREGCFFVTGGMEHGGMIMLWKGDWDQRVYERLKEASWCVNRFEEGGDLWWARGVVPYEEFLHTTVPDEVDLDDGAAVEAFPEELFVPGKRYRITVEELLEEGAKE